MVENRDFSNPLHSTLPLGGPRRNIAIMFGGNSRMVWLATKQREKFNMFSLSCLKFLRIQCEHSMSYIHTNQPPTERATRASTTSASAWLTRNSSEDEIGERYRLNTPSLYKQLAKQLSAERRACKLFVYRTHLS